MAYGDTPNTVSGETDRPCGKRSGTIRKGPRECTKLLSVVVHL